MRVGPTLVKIGKAVLYPTDKLEWTAPNRRSQAARDNKYSQLLSIG